MHCWPASVILALACLPGGLAADSLDDFTNNLLSDLAPILALLGERVTTQFMSQSLGWEDCVVLAMAPIGIVTIIVSAVRVGGPTLLKAIVGRARESQSIAEMEVMSSTSDEVCEMYNGQSIVRCQGKAPVWEFICLVPDELDEKERMVNNEKPPEIEFMTLHEALKKSKLKQVKGTYLGFNTKRKRVNNRKEAPETASWEQITTPDGQEDRPHVSIKRKPGSLRSLVSKRQQLEQDDIESAGVHNDKSTKPPSRVEGEPNRVQEPCSRNRFSEQTITVIHDTRPGAPNLCLNLQYDPNRQGVRIAAVAGVLIQAGVLVFAAVMVLHPAARERFRKDGDLVPWSAFAMMCIGTVLLNLGLLICAHVVESSTTEEQYQPDEGAKVSVHMFWIQQKQTVNDQFFDSYAIFPCRASSIVTKSRRTYATTVWLSHIFLVASAIKIAAQSRGSFLTELQKRMAGRDLEYDRNGLESDSEMSQQAALAASKLKTLIGTVITIAGFVLQFIGLRSMNSYASLAQLGAVALMTAWRAWLRRGFANDFRRRKLLPGFELDWLAWKIGSCWHEPQHPFKQTDAAWDEKEGYHKLPGSWFPVTGLRRAAETPDRAETVAQENEARRIFMARRELGRLTNFHGNTAQESANLAQAIEKTMDQLFPLSRLSDLKIRKLQNWRLDTIMGNDSSAALPSRIPIELTPQKGHWSVRADDFNALMSLWMYSVAEKRAEIQQQHGSEKEDAWIRKAIPPYGVRLFGPAEDRQRSSLRQDLMWWMPLRNLKFLEIKFLQSNTSHTDTQNPVDRRGRVHDSSIVGCVPTNSQELVSRPPGEDTVLCKPIAWGTVFDEHWDNRILAIESSGTLENLYAKDLLFTFMRWAADQLDSPLGSQTEARAASDHTFTFVYSGELHQVVEMMRGLGFGSEGELYLSLLCALSMAAKLPGPRAIFDARREESAVAYHRGILTEVDQVYQDLIKTVYPYSETDTRIYALGAALYKAYEKTIRFKAQWASNKILPRPFNVLSRGPDTSWDKESVMEFLEELYVLQRQRVNLPTYPDYFHVTELHRACARGSLRKVADALKQSDINEQDVYGWTPLHYAAARGDGDLARLLLREGADVQRADFGGYTALHHSSKFVDITIIDHVESHLKMTERINWSKRVCAVLPMRGNDGMTPLHMAAEEGNVKNLCSLCRALADDIDFAKLAGNQDQLGFTPFHTAAAHAQVIALEELKLLGADIHKSVRDGRTALHLAAAIETREQRQGTVDKLIELSIDLEIKDENGETALLLAARCQIWDVISRLIRAKADVNTMDNQKRTPLYWVARAGHSFTLTLLKAHGANIDETNKDGYTLLQWAVWEKAVDDIGMLLRNGANPNFKEKGPDTPLDQVLWIGDMRLIFFMLDRGRTVDRPPTMDELKKNPEIRSKIESWRSCRQGVSKSVAKNLEN